MYRLEFKQCHFFSLKNWYSDGHTGCNIAAGPVGERIIISAYVSFVMLLMLTVFSKPKNKQKEQVYSESLKRYM